MNAPVSLGMSKLAPLQDGDFSLPGPFHTDAGNAAVCLDLLMCQVLVADAERIDLG
jgi:hypothetical protein